MVRVGCVHVRDRGGMRRTEVERDRGCVCHVRERR